VAFVLNKDLIEAKSVKTQELVKGRVLELTIKWNGQETTLINVYAPNRRSEHPDFWESIETERQRAHTPKPDFVLGDFNVTENTIDRVPPRLDSTEATTALREFRLALEIHDQWRHEYPKAREYTYRARNNEQSIRSRLDRIYVAKDKAKFTFDWEMAPSTVPTDHWMVSLRYAPKDAPYIGTGRWTMPIKATKDRKIIDKIKENGMRLQEELKELRENPETRTQEKNPQNLWKNFKYISAKWAEFVTKNTHYKRATKLKNLHRDWKALLENPEFETNQDLQWNEALITKEIEYLERKTSKENRGITNAKIVTAQRKTRRNVVRLEQIKKAKRPDETIKNSQLNPAAVCGKIRQDGSTSETIPQRNTEQGHGHINKREERESHGKRTKCNPRRTEVPRPTQLDPKRKCIRNVRGNGPEKSKKWISNRSRRMPI
jgi:hypothetical protein